MVYVIEKPSSLTWWGLLICGKYFYFYVMMVEHLREGFNLCTAWGRLSTAEPFTRYFFL